MKKKQNSKLYIMLAVGIVSALGPFVTDFYLPSLPTLSTYFNTTASLVQFSLTFSMIGLAVGQLIIGPLSDKYGRKSPLIISLIVFSFATIACLYSPSIHWFIFFRLIQGLAGAGGVVISRSIAIDLYQGQDLTRFFSMLSSIQGLAPICAPILGGLLIEITDWRGIFGVLLVVGLLLILVLLPLRESLPLSNRKKGGILTTFKYYLPALRNKQFMCFVLVQAFAMGVMFTYIASSPFIFQNHFGISPIAYSLFFALNALGIMAGSVAVSAFSSTQKALRLGSTGFFIMSIVVAIALVSFKTVIGIEVALFFLMFFLGLILPCSTTLALDMERGNSGNASALLGFLMFLFGGILSPLTGLGNMLYSTGFLIVLCGTATLVLTRFSIKLSTF